MNYSDDDRISYSTGGSYDYHEFRFKIDEGVWSIAQISMLHEGYGSGGHALYIWNYNTVSWEMVSSTTESGPPDKILTGIRNSGFPNYIQGGYLQLLAIANEPDSTTIYTDYVKVETTSTTPAAVPTLSQWGMIGMAIVLAAFLVWSVRRRWVVNAGKS